MPAKKEATIQVRDFTGTRSEFFRKYPHLKLPPIRRPTNKTADDEKGSLDGCWIWGSGLDEDFSIGDAFTTREEAIADAQRNSGQAAGEHFQTGILHFVEHVPSLPTDSDRLIEDAGENLHGEWHEAAVENWTDDAAARMEDLDLRMNKAWDQWIEAHGLTIHGYTCEHVESHEVGPDPDDTVEPEVATP